MKQKLCVLLGDVLSSRRIEDKEAFQEKLEKTCSRINTVYADEIYAGFKILKGIDEIEGVLPDISNIYEIITSISEQLYPNSMRFAFVMDYIDTAVKSRDTAKMDGPAFHKASDMMKGLKKSKSLFDMSTDNEITDALITGEINLILLIKKNWSAKQHLVVREYKRTRNQYETAKTLGITQQAVSKALARSMWNEIRPIEEKLDHVVRSLSVRDNI